MEVWVTVIVAIKSLWSTTSVQSLLAKEINMTLKPCNHSPVVRNLYSVTSIAALILMARRFSTRASVATVLITHPCVPSCLWANIACGLDICRHNISILWVELRDYNQHTFLLSDDTCGASYLGTKNIDGMEWSDETCALSNGPVTEIRIWLTNRRPKLWVNIN